MKKNYPFLKKLLTFVAAMLLCGTPFLVKAQSYQVHNMTTGLPINTFTTLQAAVTACVAGDSCVITLTENDNLNAVVTVDGNRNVTLTSSGNDTIFLQVAGTASFHIIVNGTSILTLTHITLDGLNKTNSGIAAQVSGGNSKVHLKAGAVIRDCYSGVDIRQSGNNCYMYEGATLTQNTRGICVAYHADFDMMGGEISYNDAQAIVTGSANNVIIDMSGGTINNNTSNRGCIYLASGTSFRMRGNAAVRNNTSYSSAGAIFMEYGTVFSMYDNAVIEYNQTPYDGGAISGDQYLAGIYIYGGEIRNNTAGGVGGGIYLVGGTTFNTNNVFKMYGGAIKNNVAGGDGGGLYLESCDFLMEGGKITENVSGGKGGGAFFVEASAYTPQYGSCIVSSSAIISGNTAGTDGGGVYIDLTPFSMTGGSITDNTAGNKGGGIFTEDYNQLELGADAVFSGNTADNPYWLGQETTGGYDPGTGELSYSDIKTLYPTKIATTSFSSSSTSCPFTYLYNNYDVNFVGETMDCGDIPIDTICFTTDFLTLEVDVVNGGVNPSYQWILNGDEVADANGIEFKFKPRVGLVDTVLCKVFADVDCADEISSQTMVIEMLPKPTLNPIGNIEACDGDLIGGITFTGSNFNDVQWVLSGTAVGLSPTSGTGNIPSFTAANSGTSPVKATITATPLSDSCAGDPITFTITVNPKVKLNAKIKIK